MFKTQLAYDNWKSKYRYGKEEPIDTWKRVAKFLASVEKDQDYWTDKFLNTIVNFDSNRNPIGLKCTPGGRITANAGTSFKTATLVNCYVNGPVTNAKISYTRTNYTKEVSYPVEIVTSESPDNLNNIFLTILEQAKTLASEGGYGINFSFIRPRGALINGVGIRHPGVVSYMQIWDAASECIVKGDTDGYKDKIKNYLSKENTDTLKKIVKQMARKGAMMGVLDISHPDIEEFVKAKQSSGKLTKFNISVAVDDKFMIAVETDDFYDLSFGGKVFKKIKARELYNLIMESTYNRAEPGIIFVDNAHKNNPVSYLGKCNASNPCGEVMGLADITSVCLLGSVNLTQYVKKDRTFDFDLYKEDVKIFTRMLDNVNDLTSNPLSSYQWAVKNLRQIGMGLNGLGSALIMMGLKYASLEAKDFIKKVCSLKEDLTWQTSAELAVEKGVVSVYNKKKFLNTEYFKSSRITQKTKDLIEKNGVRNCKTTTYPPNGNASILSDNVSNGIEPIFNLEYERIVITSEWPEGMNKDNVQQLLKHNKKKDYEYWKDEYKGKLYYYEPHNRGLCTVSIIRDYGYQWILDNFPAEKAAEYLSTTTNLSVQDHIDVQEIVQYYCNQSVSKTVNLPNDYSFEDFKNLYIDGWKKGLNGLTTYREGSMESVISSIKKAEKSREIMKTDIKLPDVFVNGPTTIIKREGKKFYIHFSYLPEDAQMKFPVCLWIYTNASSKGALKLCNKAAKELANLARGLGIEKSIVEAATEKAEDDEPHNKLGRMISLNLRHNVPIEKIYETLCHINGDNISSLLTAIRKFIASGMPDGTIIKGYKCPDCKGENVILESGCKKCRDCGFSGCS
jgi:ribonucleoside-diphosphate reductase alpha chain